MSAEEPLKLLQSWRKSLFRRCFSKAGHKWQNWQLPPELHPLVWKKAQGLHLPEECNSLPAETFSADALHAVGVPPPLPSAPAGAETRFASSPWLHSSPCSRPMSSMRSAHRASEDDGEDVDSAVGVTLPGVERPLAADSGASATAIA